MLWAFVPFMTFGFGTPFSFMFAALRRRSWSLGQAAAGYGAGVAGVLVLLGVGEPAMSALGVMLMLLLCLSGTVHSLAIRPSVYPRSGPRDRLNRYAVDIAKYRRGLRDEARALVAEDPALAHELRIGRPDLPRTYDDGGLVDVNHVPAATLALLPGLTQELVERIVRVRERQGGFVSCEEMAVDTDLPPDLVPRLLDFTIFVP